MISRYIQRMFSTKPDRCKKAVTCGKVDLEVHCLEEPSEMTAKVPSESGFCPQSNEVLLTSSNVCACV